MNLFLPEKLGTLPLSNHFLRSGVPEGLALKSGAPHARLDEHYLQLIEGQASTIICGPISVTATSQPGLLSLHSIHQLASYRRLTDAVHEKGGLILARLSYPAAQQENPGEAYWRLLRSAERSFSHAAAKAKEAGFDGIQLDFTFYSLPGCFLSRRYNQREDEYGGEIHARIRFPRDLYRAARQAVGPDYPVWVCLESGKLLSLTYMREQEIWAWAEHESSGGEFRSVSSIREGSEDNVYFVVRRNGKYFLEYQVRRAYGDPVEDSFFVDCGLDYRGGPIQHVTGLSHLANQTVSALADGSAICGLTVAADGSVDLPFPASVIRVGLPYTFLVETLDPEIKSQEGQLVGEKRTVVRAVVTVRETSSLEIGPTEDALLPLKFPLPETWNAPPVLFSGSIQAALPGAHREEACVVFRHTAPLPATVLSILTQISVG